MRFASRAVMFLSFVLLLHACGDSPCSGHHGVTPPRDEVDAEYPAFVQQARAPSVVAEVLLPAMDKALSKMRRSEARMAMLLAAILVVEDGPESLKDIQDPFGPGPFEYRALERGFELRSALVVEGEPVTLTVRRRK